MSFTIHPTADPRIFFAGGNFFGEECLSHFDGIIGYVHGGFSPLHSSAGFAHQDGLIRCPNILHGVAPHDEQPTVRQLPEVIRRDLNTMMDNGCRRIGFLGAETNTTYAEGAKVCIRTIVEWLDHNPGAFKSVTLVIDDDDYYRRFGKDPFRTGALIFNPNPTPFESWFEKDFPSELAVAFTIDRRVPDTMFNPNCILLTSDTPRPFEHRLFAPQTEFSVALFYMVLLPQVAAKTRSKMSTLYAFAKSAGWPYVDMLMAGHISPYAVLKETGLLPAPDKVQEWVNLAKSECRYFESIVNTLITGRIYDNSPEAIVLSELNSRYKGEIRDGIRSYLKSMTDYLLGNGPEPEWDYLKEQEILAAQKADPVV